MLRREVIETIVELRCPAPHGCGRVFFEFTDCFAVNCLAEDGSGCANNFCAFCLASFGKHGPGSEAAHAHVANCPHNTAPGRDLFGGPNPRAVFQQAQRARRARQLTAFVAGKAPAVRGALLAALAADLDMLGMRAADFAG
jgi:hypothetical protein